LISVFVSDTVPAESKALTATEALERLKRIPDTVVLPCDREWVFILKALIDPPVVWIGKTQGPLRPYLCSAQSRSPVPLKLVAAFSASAGTKSLIQDKFRNDREHADWFRLSSDLADFIGSVPKGGPLSPSTTTQLVAGRDPV
jgi:hypothetical protein